MRQRHVVRMFEVGLANDAGLPVRRPQIVRRGELFEPDDAVAPPGQMGGRGRTHRTQPDHHRVHLATRHDPHDATSTGGDGETCHPQSCGEIADRRPDCPDACRADRRRHPPAAARPVRPFWPRRHGDGGPAQRPRPGRRPGRVQQLGYGAPHAGRRRAASRRVAATTSRRRLMRAGYGTGRTEGRCIRPSAAATSSRPADTPSPSCRPPGRSAR